MYVYISYNYYLVLDLRSESCLETRPELNGLSISFHQLLLGGCSGAVIPWPLLVYQAGVALVPVIRENPSARLYWQWEF